MLLQRAPFCLRQTSRHVHRLFDEIPRTIRYQCPVFDQPKGKSTQGEFLGSVVRRFLRRFGGSDRSHVDLVCLESTLGPRAG